MAKLQKLNPDTKPKTLKERITLLELSLAESQKQYAALSEAVLNSKPIMTTLETFEQANGQSAESSPLDNLELANGQVKETDLDRVKRLETVLCTAQTNPFGTTDYGIFEQSLEGMTMASLQSLAQRVGVNPWSSMPEVKKDLKTAFVHTNSQGTLKQRPPTKNRTLNPNDPKDLKVMQLLGMKVA